MKTLTGIATLILGVFLIAFGAHIGVIDSKFGGIIVVGFGVMTCAASLMLLNTKK